MATNSPFAEWDKIFGDPRLCAAIADRITFRCTLIQTGTESYRFRITEAERRKLPGCSRGQSRLERGVRSSTRSRIEVSMGSPRLASRRSFE
ncbi:MULTISPECIES: ATP-binding protein [Streptomyces]|uniref:ATP-binding protein n=1 Tax=Streptomyces TaxID=1883 RepID=UPI00167BE304|nr:MULTISPECIES: ATP-binding protein [Streptomyces]MBD3580512.1 hypothetical protein [Streptomyces sp. KD18]GGT30465.1 hypothetical protein GCM10010286_64520 [Streptomyces toxytricini]